MRAVVLRDYGGFDRLRLEETEIPPVGAGEILIRNRAVGVNHCDTDVRRGVFGVAQNFPHVMGVDSAGEVAAVGAGVQGFAVGDRASPHFLLSCGSCRNCVAGKENICLNAGVLGVTTWGTYAEFVKVPAHNAVRLPENISFDDAVAVQIPFATAWEALIEVGRLAVGGPRQRRCQRPRLGRRSDRQARRRHGHRNHRRRRKVCRSPITRRRCGRQLREDEGR
jgi:NADPH:quinone reductase-like Zn-dependent oxidoreductase